jgi:hypothetical protein
MFQMMILLKSLVSSILLRFLFYRGGGLIIPPASRVTGVQMMLLMWMQGQMPWTMTQWQGIWGTTIFEASMRQMYIYIFFFGLVDSTIL